jgi:hypothetical protein
VVLALFLALEGHIIVLQAVAWGGMLAAYSQDSSIEVGIEKTFDGKHPCELCSAIHKVRQTGKKQGQQTVLKKITLLCDLPAEFIAGLPAFWKLSFSDTWYQTLAREPLVLPPRALLS